MNKRTFDKLDLDVFEDVLENGLKVYICPLDRNGIHARMVTRYGSSVLEFKPEGKDDYIKIPKGTAHFLEHKMFAQEDGTDIMDVFHKNGATSNAYTSAFQTVYHFTGPTHFMDNLENLLNCVTKPYYTEENVAREMGIIDQEIKASFDNPGNMAYYTTIKNVFSKVPFRYPVAGTSASIKEITPDILYDCYNTFYHPSNMYLVITGNVDVVKTMDFIRNYFASRNYEDKKEITIKKYSEPREVFKKREVIKRDVTNKIIDSGYKVYIGDNDLPLNRLLSYLSIYLIVKFGSISKFNKMSFEDKNILSPVSWYVTVVDDFVMVEFGTEVIEENNIFELIYDNINDKHFSADDFDLVKKNSIKSFVVNSDGVGSVANMIDYQVNLYGDVIYSTYDELINLNYDECLNVIREMDFSNYTCTIVER